MAPVTRIVDVLLAVLLVAGNVLALPIWWWLVGTLVVRVSKGCRRTTARVIE